MWPPLDSPGRDQESRLKSVGDKLCDDKLLEKTEFHANNSSLGRTKARAARSGKEVQDEAAARLVA
jgi:hypothetical protein